MNGGGKTFWRKINFAKVCREFFLNFFYVCSHNPPVCGHAMFLLCSQFLCQPTRVSHCFFALFLMHYPILLTAGVLCRTANIMVAQWHTVYHWWRTVHHQRWKKYLPEPYFCFLKSAKASKLLMLHCASLSVINDTQCVINDAHNVT